MRACLRVCKSSLHRSGASALRDQRAGPTSLLAEGREASLLAAVATRHLSDVDAEKLLVLRVL